MRASNSKSAGTGNQKRSNGRPHSLQAETDDFPTCPTMTVVSEASPSGRKVDAMETLNPHADRNLDRLRSSLTAAPLPGAVNHGFSQATVQRSHHQDDASTSSRGLASYLSNVPLGNDPITGRGDEADVERFKRKVRDLEELLSELNPVAEESVLPSLAHSDGLRCSNTLGSQDVNSETNVGPCNRKNSSGQAKRRMGRRTNLAQREDVIRRTVYVSNVDQQVTEEQIATLFINCGRVVDCRICGDSNSFLRFAFIEFTDEEGARAALCLSGTTLGYYPVKVLPSKTAIAPVNPSYLPRSEGEIEVCSRTVYCTNIDKKVTHADLKLFFESQCGEVRRLRLLGDRRCSTGIAFIEFMQTDSATLALDCSGATLGFQKIRVSPSKTPLHR